VERDAHEPLLSARAVARAALTELRAVAGTLLDPAVVEALCAVVEEEAAEADGSIEVRAARSQLLEQAAIVE
jgi:HD-GYP domain-containing protein (c-di-GMP phosphodiesterase class II)